MRKFDKGRKSMINAIYDLNDYTESCFNTYIIAVCIMDKFLEQFNKQDIKPVDAKYISASSWWLASKWNEDSGYDSAEYISMIWKINKGQHLTRKTILIYENKILKHLNWIIPSIINIEKLGIEENLFERLSSHVIEDYELFKIAREHGDFDKFISDLDDGIVKMSWTNSNIRNYLQRKILKRQSSSIK